MGHKADTLSIKLKVTWDHVLLAQISESERTDKRDEGDKMNKMRDGRRHVVGSAYRRYYYLIPVRTMHGDFY